MDLNKKNYYTIEQEILISIAIILIFIGGILLGKTWI